LPLGKLPRGKYPWQVAAWEKEFGKLPNILPSYRTHYTSAGIWYTTHNIGALPLQFVGIGYKEIIIWVKYTFFRQSQIYKTRLLN